MDTTTLGILVLLVTGAASTIPFIVKRYVLRKYPNDNRAEYIAGGVMMLVCLVLAICDKLFFFPTVDIQTSFVRSILIIGLLYNSSLRLIDKRLLNPPTE